MSEEVIIKVEDLSKVYKLYDSHRDRVKEALNPFGKKYHKDFHALKGVSFEVKKGETVGIIGENGSGKSTLLQILTGVSQPTSGSVEVNGNVSALLELGAGFNPEFTGIQNVYFNGSIMGYTKEEMDERLDDILAFADIGDFVYQPIKIYSSGMLVRLAFATAINVDPDILIVDEALSVGDVNFQLKCMTKMVEFIERRKTVLFVSHDTSSVRKICSRVVWLDVGAIKLIGDQVISITDKYQSYMKMKQTEENGLMINPNSKKYRKKVEILEVFLTDKNGKKKSTFKFGEEIHVVAHCEFIDHIDSPVFGIAILDNSSYYICGLNTKLDNVKLNYNIGENEFKLIYRNLRLLGGTYQLKVGIFEKTSIQFHDFYSKDIVFEVNSHTKSVDGIIEIDHEWVV